jgi:hypothetical protein
MLLRVLLSVFFIAHGLVHVAIWALKYDPEKAPFDASHSWLLGDQRRLARELASLAAAIFIVAGIALLAQGGGGGRPTAVVGLSVSTALLVLYFNRWYLFILAVNLALIVGVAWLDWPSPSTVGPEQDHDGGPGQRGIRGHGCQAEELDGRPERALRVLAVPRNEGVNRTRPWPKGQPARLRMAATRLRAYTLAPSWPISFQ